MCRDTCRRLTNTWDIAAHAIKRNTKAPHHSSTNWPPVIAEALITAPAVHTHTHTHTKWLIMVLIRWRAVSASLVSETRKQMLNEWLATGSIPLSPSPVLLSSLLTLLHLTLLIEPAPGIQASNQSTCSRPLAWLCGLIQVSACGRVQVSACWNKLAELMEGACFSRLDSRSVLVILWFRLVGTLRADWSH